MPFVLQGVSAAFRIRRSFGCGCGAVTPNRIMLAVERAGLAQAGAAAQFGSPRRYRPAALPGSRIPATGLWSLCILISVRLPPRVGNSHCARLAGPIVQVQDDAGGRGALWRGQLQDAAGAGLGHYGNSRETGPNSVAMSRRPGDRSSRAHLAGMASNKCNSFPRFQDQRIAAPSR